MNNLQGMNLLTQNPLSLRDRKTQPVFYDSFYQWCLRNNLPMKKSNDSVVLDV